jgi:hypothetical protein
MTLLQLIVFAAASVKFANVHCPLFCAADSYIATLLIREGVHLIVHVQFDTAFGAVRSTLSFHTIATGAGMMVFGMVGGDTYFC